MKKIYSLAILLLAASFHGWAAEDVELSYSNAIQMYWNGGITAPADGRLTIDAWNGIRWANLNLPTKDYACVSFTFSEGLPANLSFEVYYTGDDEGTNKTQTDPAEGDKIVTMLLDTDKTIATIYIKTRDAAATISLDKGIVKAKMPGSGLPTGVVIPEGWETASEAITRMTTGLNIGNTLDSYGSYITGTSPRNYETAWGNPQITTELVQAMKQGGFNAVRLPVTWYQNMSADGTVREAWMNRVQEVVDYIINEGMYCILDVHHDTGADSEAWLKADITNVDDIRDRLTLLWTQIATRFRDYGDHLIFEGYNEMLDQDNHWTMTNASGYAAHNLLSQAFVTAVRQTGGHNAYRSLLVNTYSADPGQYTTSYFSLPADCVEGQLIVGAHVYAPGSFTSLPSDADAPVWTDAMAEQLTDVLQQLRDAFPTLPIIIGEFGANGKVADSEAAKYATTFVSQASTLFLGRFYWFDIINRRTYDWTMPLLKRALLGEDTETGIEAAEKSEELKDKSCYDLLGHRICREDNSSKATGRRDSGNLFTPHSSLRKGIHIVGGRKIIRM